MESATTWILDSAWEQPKPNRLVLSKVINMYSDLPNRAY